MEASRPVPLRRDVAIEHRWNAESVFPDLAAWEEAASTLAADLAQSRREDAHALIEAGRMSVAGVQALLERRIDTLREALSELRAVGKLMSHAGARETVAHVDELARGAVELTLASVREMMALASSTQREALAVLARRLQADLLEFRQLQSALRQRPPN